MKRIRRQAVGLVCLILFLGLAVSCEREKEASGPSPETVQSEAASRQTAGPSEESGSFAQLAKMASPAVVNIGAVRVTGKKDLLPFGDLLGEDNPLNRLFKRFFGDHGERGLRQGSLGSGFIIDKGGYILTNNHVVENAEEIQVTLPEGKKFEAKIVGRDPKTDIALIRIDAGTPLTPLPLGDSDQAEVGDWVLAIGCPFGLGNTVTAGIVSAKYRKIGSGPYDDFIQTDASINPGNSGGPLLNTKGEVIGINTAIFSQSGGSIGIGFAVPINMAKDLLPQLKKGEVVRGWLGVSIQKVTPDLADKFGLAEAKGALVSDVTQGGPADKAGIVRGDVIVSFDGKEIKTMADLPYIVGGTPVGKTVKVEIIRKRENKSLEVKVGEMKRQA
jgi:serine protease Do